MDGDAQRQRFNSSRVNALNQYVLRRQQPQPQQEQREQMTRFEQLQRSRLHDQALVRSYSAPDARLGHAEYNLSIHSSSNRTASFPHQQHLQQNHYGSPLSHSFTPPSSCGSLVALLREQRSPDIESSSTLFGGREGGHSRQNSDDEEDEVSSILMRSRSGSESAASPMQSQDHAMEDATSHTSSSPVQRPAPVTTRQQTSRAAKASAAASARLSTASAASTGSAASTSEKRSRYLREVDRRSIIHRIDRGEKQAALAKEFGVTRAAICHINKNRVEILTRSTRADVHSGARHPKRGLYTTSASSASTASKTRATYESNPSVFEVRSQTMAVLMTTLRKRETRSREFQVCTDRAFRLLLEEALSRVAMRVVEVVTPNDFVCEGVAAVKPSCGISISEDGFALLQVFRCIQPSSPSGYITLNATAIHEGVSSEPTLQKVCVPPDLRTYDVFLMEATCATGAGACVAIQALLDFGAQEGSIHFVCLLASAFAVSEICSRFPAVHIVTGAVDPEVNDVDAICPGFGNFSERYFNATVVHHMSVGAIAGL